MLSGYESVGKQTVGSGPAAAPLASFFTFALCGNFASPHLAAATARPSQLKSNFKELARLLARFPTLAKHAHFVLVPGPDDPTVGAADVLPRAQLSASMAAPVSEAVANVTLGTSPTRLLICGQEVVVMREELLVKARRACVLPPKQRRARADDGADDGADADDGDGGDDECDLNFQLVKSVIDQAYLCPLPPTEAAVFWERDTALWLHPSPDVLVIADRQEQFVRSYEETAAFNPSSFAAAAQWMVYRPASREAEPSALQ